MAAETRPLLIVSAPHGLLAETLFVKAELDPTRQNTTTNDYGGRQRTQRDILDAVQDRLAGLPWLVLEATSHKLNGFPQIAVTPILADYHDESERRERAGLLLEALAAGGERLDGFALAHWAVRTQLGQRFDPTNNAGRIDLGQIRHSGPIVRSALAPWLAGRLPLADPTLFRQYHLDLPDDVHAICGFVLSATDHASANHLTGYGGDPSLLALLPPLIGDGWLTEGQDKFGRYGTIYKIGPKLRRLARYEVLIY